MSNKDKDRTFEFEAIPNFASSYLTTYYTKEPTDDEIAVLSFTIRHLANLEPVDSALEVGCGPTIHHVLPFVPYIDQIHMTEYLDDNLEQVKMWRDKHPQAHNWNHYTSLVLSLENQPHQISAIKQREEDLRQKITTIESCNLKEEYPLGEIREYPLVGSFYTADQISSRKSDWRLYMKNLSNLVASEGWLFLSALGATNCYRIHLGEEIREIPVTYLTKEDFHSLLPELGFDPQNIFVEEQEVSDFQEEGLNGVILVAAKKLSS